MANEKRIDNMTTPLPQEENSKQTLPKEQSVKQGNGSEKSASWTIKKVYQKEHVAGNQTTEVEGQDQCT